VTLVVSKKIERIAKIEKHEVFYKQLVKGLKTNPVLHPAGVQFVESLFQWVRAHADQPAEVRALCDAGIPRASEIFDAVVHGTEADPAR
jgi:hypothetical protein